MSIIVKKSNDTKFKLFVKGSPEKIFELCLKDSIPANFHIMLDFYAQKGYRVLAFAIKNLKMKYRKI
jgi:cation-transporting ATPase 13A2